MIRTATVDEIEQHLLKLGGGNHPDNVATIQAFPRHYLLSLAQEGFMDLIFLQNLTVSKIVSRGSDRRLGAVAQRARELLPTEANLGSNWDIATVLAKFKLSRFSQPGVRLPAFVLRDTRDCESDWSSDGWYLQDGSHRALAYAMTLLAGEITYHPQLAFCATSKHMAA